MNHSATYCGQYRLFRSKRRTTEVINEILHPGPGDLCSGRDCFRTDNEQQLRSNKLWCASPGEEWGDTISVAADGKGSILVFRRAEPPVLVYNRSGELQSAWGEGMFVDTHSIDVDHEGFVWVTDRRAHMVYKFTMDGQLLMALGTKGVAGDNSSRNAFNRPSDIVIAPNGDIFVADGYENNRVVHFSRDGAFIKIIGGTPGTGPGEFEELHGIKIDSMGSPGRSGPSFR